MAVVQPRQHFLPCECQHYQIRNLTEVADRFVVDETATNRVPSRKHASANKTAAISSEAAATSTYQASMHNLDHNLYRPAKCTTWYGTELPHSVPFRVNRIVLQGNSKVW